MSRSWKWLKYNHLAPNLISFKKTLEGDNSKILHPKLPQAFFIVCSGRNGSTVLAKHLNFHSNIFLPPEIFALPFSIMRYHLKINQGWASFIEEFLVEVKNNNDNWMLDDKDYNLVAQELKKLSPEFQNFNNAYRTLYHYIGKKYKNEILYVGDHSPINTRYYKTTIPELTKAKFIFLLRDPIDTIYSYTKIKGHPLSDPEKAAWNWNHSVSCFDFIKKKNLPVLLIKYEELVTAAKQTLNRVIDFLSLPHENLMEEDKTIIQEDVIGANNHSFHTNVYKPLTSKFIGKGYKNLPHQTVKRVEKIVEANATRFDYSLKPDYA